MRKMLCGALLCPRTAGWQGNTIRRGAQRPKNRVTRFTPWQRWCRKAPKGEKPPQVANSAGEEQRHETHCGRGRRLAVSYAIECHGGTMPRTPFCCFAALSLKGKQEIELENLCVKCALCHSGGSPLWWLVPPPFPRKRGHYGCWAWCHMILQVSGEMFILPPE